MQFQYQAEFGVIDSPVVVTQSDVFFQFQNPIRRKRTSKYEEYNVPPVTPIFSDVFFDPYLPTGKRPRVDSVEFNVIDSPNLVIASDVFFEIDNPRRKRKTLETKEFTITDSPVIIVDSQSFFEFKNPERKLKAFSSIQEFYNNFHPSVGPINNKHSLMEFFNLRIRLDVKKAVDSGQITANSGDVGGTTVTFNKAFKDIDSITGTVQETTAFIVVIDFVDVPNPTTFKVYVFDRATGARATKLVYWIARGII